MSRLLTETFPGAPGGMNLALPAHDIDDTEAQYIQDGLVDFPGLTRRRGPVRPDSSIAQPSRPVSGIVSALNPRGEPRYAVLNGDASNGYFSVYSADRQSLVDIPWPFGLPTDPDSGQPYRLVDAKASITGGTLIGVSSHYGTDDNIVQALALWMGGDKADYSTGTITVSRGSRTVTGSSTAWLENASSGMFLFANTDDGYSMTYVGTVREVDGDGTITLIEPALYPVTGGSYTLKSLRGITARVTTGSITCATDSTEVNGGNTKFAAQGLGTGSWNLYRANDLAWIGKVSSVTSDTQLQLAANAAIAMASESYVAIRADADWSPAINSDDKPGWITAQWAGRQWYLNNGTKHERTFQLAWADALDAEGLDLTADGNHIKVGSASIVQEPARGMLAANNALLIFKDRETFALFGTSPDNFELKKLENDGTLSGMSIQPYAGGVIWAGNEGIHFYDGVEVRNLVAEKLGDVWKNSIRTFDATKYRMYSMMVRNHYWLFIEDIEPSITPIKGSKPSSTRTWVVVINMISGAVTMATNVGIRGAVVRHDEAGKPVWYVVNDDETGYVCTADDLYEVEDVDTIECQRMSAGPDFFFESKKFDAGDALRGKKFKTLLLYYLAQGGSLKVDVVLGLNNFGRTLVSEFPESVMTWDRLKTEFATWDDVADRFPTWNDIVRAVFVPKRVKFQKQSQHLSFRIYQSTLDMPRLRLGPFQIGFKVTRAGRV